MAVIRPNATPAATAVAAGDIFLIDGATGVRALAATSVPLRDANANAAINNLLEGFATTVTAAGTTVLTVASAGQQFFTGTTTQTVQLPVTSTLTLGQSWFFQNGSTGAITVNSSGGNAVKIIGPGTSAIVTCVSLTGTTAASWQPIYFDDIAASGKVLTVSNSLTLAGTDGTTMTFPGASDTVVTLAAAQTLSNKTLVGTGTNDNAAAGNVGEYVESVIASGSAVALSAGAFTNVISISLTAGDWDVDGVLNFLFGTTTSVTRIVASISLSSGTQDGSAGRTAAIAMPAFVPGSITVLPEFTLSVPPLRFSLAATTTIFFVADGVFTVSTMSAFGILRARRVR
jgi:hypothetical protein